MVDYIDSSLKDIPLEQLGLSVLANNSLRRAGLVSVYDVCQRIKADTILTIKNVGAKHNTEIIEKTNQFLLSYDSSPLETNQVSPDLITNPLPVKKTEGFNLPDISSIANLQLATLKYRLGSETVSALEGVGVEKIQDFHALVNRYINFLGSGSDLTSTIICELVMIVSDLVKTGSLSENCFVESTTLSDLICWQPTNDNESDHKLQLLKRILEEKSLSNEINWYTSALTDRQREVFLDYSFHDLTLEAIGAKQSVTRERIRQIVNDAANKLRHALDSSLKAYISTSFEIAKEMGSSLSRDSWKGELIQRQILTDNDKEYVFFDFFIALLKNKITSQSIFGVPENVQLILKSESSHPVYVISALSGDIHKELKEIERIVKFTGGISAERAIQIIGCESSEIAELLRVINLYEAFPSWFTSVAKADLNKNTPLFRAGLMMMQTCGPLPFDSFCDGLQRYVSRHYEEIAPPEVIRIFFQNFDFKVNNDIVSYSGNEQTEMPESEGLILQLLSVRGPVLNFQEIVEFFITNGKSFATATTKIMPRSPIIEKVEHSLYKLRGSKISPQDIETAKSRLEENTMNPEVIYGSDGIVRYRLTLGSWATGGVLSIGRTCRPLPDFREGWPVYVDDEAVGTARRDDYLIWGLASALNRLGSKIGDRVELAFDIFNGPRINFRIVGEIID